MTEPNAFNNSENNSPRSVFPVRTQTCDGSEIEWQLPVSDAARAALVKIEFYFQPLAANRVGSPFYAGRDGIARLSLDDRQVMIYANGDIRLKFEPDGCFYKNSQVTDELVSRQMNDDDYRALGERGFLDDENWFEIAPLLPNETELEVLPDIDGDIPDALSSAIACLFDDEFWQNELAEYKPEPETPAMIECGNCDKDFPQGSGTKGDLFCSSHCALRHYGEECDANCSACVDDLIETPVSESVETVGNWVVPVIFQGQDNFIVENATRGDAEKIAAEKFGAGEQPDEFGNEWQKFVRTGEPELIG